MGGLAAKVPRNHWVRGIFHLFGLATLWPQLYRALARAAGDRVHAQTPWGNVRFSGLETDASSSKAWPRCWIMALGPGAA